MRGTALEARDVSKAFGAEGVLQDVDLAVGDDEILVLLGPNGVGKSVLLSCLAGSAKPNAGEVEVFGRPVAEDGGERFGYLPQETMTVDSLTGRENATVYGRLHPAFTDRWQRYVDTLSLTDALDRRVGDYSGGMRRKLELALTMSLDVDLYLLDEPTAGVDLSVIQRFHDVIVERHDAGASMVITSHRPLDVDLADRLAFVTDGTVSAAGTPADLLADVPRVVRVTGRDAITTAEDHVIGRQLFPVGGETRGFLDSERALDELRTALSDGEARPTVETVHPTHADMFNYYVHVRPAGDRP